MRLPVYERRAGVSPLSMPQIQPNPQISDNGETAAKTLHGVFARLEEIQNGMDDARTLELFNRFKLDSQEYHENPDKGIYNTRFGFQASGVYKDADEWLRQKGEDYARQLPSRRAQFNFRKMAREHIQQRGMQNSRFEAEQMRKYQQETADATIKERLNYAENHWDDDDAIAQVRTDIQQALELKMRGSGKEAFDAAMADIEDQIGVARIRQAFVRHPLQALDMLKNPDVHLKADTRAKLVESLKDKTEIYRMHGVVQAYAGQFSPENAAEARKILIERYGIEEGEKAFSAFTRYWGMLTYQEQARGQTKLKAQQKNEDDLLAKWNAFLSGETDIMPDLQDLNRRTRNGEIRPQFAHSILNQVLSKQNADKAAQAKTEKIKRDIELYVRENNGQFYSDEELTQQVLSGGMTDDEARAHQSRRDAYSRRLEQQENKRLEHNRNVFLEMIAFGQGSIEQVREQLTAHNIAPNDALAIMERIRSRDERIKNGIQQSLKEQQDAYGDIVNRLLHNGIHFPRDIINRLNKLKWIDKATANMLYADLDQYEKEQERLRSAQEKAQAKQQAEANKESWQKNLDIVARHLATEHYKDEGAGLRKIDSQEFMPELSMEQRKYLRERFTTHSYDINEEAKNYKDRHDEFQKKMHEDRLRLYEVHFNTRDEIAHAYKTLQTLLDDGLEPKYYSEAKAILDRKSRELDKADIEADKKKNAAKEAELEQNIDKWSAEIYEAYKDRGKGEALKYVERFTPDTKIKDKLHQRVARRFDNEAQAVKDNREKLSNALEDTYTDMRNEILGRSMSNDEIAQKRTEYDDMLKSRGLEENRYKGLMQILDKLERANNEAAESKRKADNYDAAKDYFNRFGLDGQHEARDTIRKDYQDTRANEIMTLFDRLVQEKQEEQNDLAKAKRLQQDNTFQDLQTKYWRNGQTIPNSELAALEQSEALRAEQIAQAHSVNWGMREKKGIAEQLAKNPDIDFAGMTTEQQEALVSKTMGVSPEQRQENIALLFRKVLDGTSTNAEIESYKARGGIWDVDAERLREYEGKFIRQQRERLGLFADNLSQEIMKLYSGSSDIKNRATIRNQALLDFQTATSTIDLHSENFEKRVEGIFNVIIGSIAEQYGKSHSMTEWIPFKGRVPTKAGERVEAAKNASPNVPPAERRIPFTDAYGDTVYIQPDGSITSSDAPVVMPNVPQPQQGQTALYDPRNNEAVNNPLMQRYSNPENYNFKQPNAERLQGVVDTTKSILGGIGYSISSGFSWGKTKLRDGRAHPAVDAAVPVGTPVHVPNYGSSWYVTKTGENATAGKFVKLQTTLPSGDVHEYTLAHLDSVDVAAGDTVSSADVVAKSGNTGNSTGPHLHIALKINGQSVDPTSVDVGNDNGISADIPPQQTIQPQIQQDPFAEFWEVINQFMSADDVLFRSNDIFDNTGRFGGGF